MVLSRSPIFCSPFGIGVEPFALCGGRGAEILQSRHGAEPSGGFRLMKATKEIDCTLEAAGMKDGANGQQFRAAFLPPPHRHG